MEYNRIEVRGMVPDEVVDAVMAQIRQDLRDAMHGTPDEITNYDPRCGFIWVLGAQPADPDERATWTGRSADDTSHEATEFTAEQCHGFIIDDEPCGFGWQRFYLHENTMYYEEV